MTKEHSLSSVQEIFKTVFKNKDLNINYSTSMKDIDDWDSLTHVIIIDSVEKQFNFKFELRDMLTIETVDDICNKIVEKSKV
jgi:acyl carrier protein